MKIIHKINKSIKDSEWLFNLNVRNKIKIYTIYFEIEHHGKLTGSINLYSFFNNENQIEESYQISIHGIKKGCNNFTNLFRITYPLFNNEIRGFNGNEIRGIKNKIKELKWTDTELKLVEENEYRTKRD